MMGSNVAKKATLTAMLDAGESPAAASRQVPMCASATTTCQEKSTRNSTIIPTASLSTTSPWTPSFRIWCEPPQIILTAVHLRHDEIRGPRLSVASLGPLQCRAVGERYQRVAEPGYQAHGRARTGDIMGRQVMASTIISRDIAALSLPPKT